jgi:colanic acid biosynthesis glycosyl transferase WcaI
MPFFGRPFLARPDAMLVISPSFPALLPAILNARLRRLPLALWLHDLLPDGAAASGLVPEVGLVLKASRWLERTAYREADRIIVLSAPFGQNLRDKGVPPEKIDLIYDAATRGIPARLQVADSDGERRVLCMGNIGLTQGLAPLVRDFEASDRMSDLNVRLVITGNGVAADDVRAEIRSDRVEMPGLVDDERLERELQSASLALVTQAYEGAEFNLPSKLMNYMAYGIPVVAAVNPASEAARLVREARAGWVTDSSEPVSLPTAIAEALSDPAELAARSRAGREYALAHFSPQAFGDAFDRELRALTGRRRPIP